MSAIDAPPDGFLSAAAEWWLRVRAANRALDEYRAADPLTMEARAAWHRHTTENDAAQLSMREMRRLIEVTHGPPACPRHEDYMEHRE